jgi:hypothetical protein
MTLGIENNRPNNEKIATRAYGDLTPSPGMEEEARARMEQHRALRAIVLILSGGEDIFSPSKVLPLPNLSEWVTRAGGGGGRGVY